MKNVYVTIKRSIALGIQPKQYVLPQHYDLVKQVRHNALLYSAMMSNNPVINKWIK